VHVEMLVTAFDSHERVGMLSGSAITTICALRVNKRCFEDVVSF
jgi:hypothetical protein